jgi:hypothetical protein
MTGKSIMQVCIAFVFLGEFSIVLYLNAMAGEAWAIATLSGIAVSILGFFGYQVTKVEK